MDSNDARNADRLVSRIKPLLAGHKPEVQGAALANLLAIWLAGHLVQGSQEETEKLRDALLEAHIEGVASFMPGAVEMIQGLIAPPQRKPH